MKVQRHAVKSGGGKLFARAEPFDTVGHVDLAQVLHSQRVVWGGQNLGDLLPVKLFHRLLSGARVGDAALEQVFRIIAAVGGADCFGCFGQQCEIAAFASKGE